MLPWKIRPFAGASAVGFWGTIIGVVAGTELTSTFASIAENQTRLTMSAIESTTSLGRYGKSAISSRFVEPVSTRKV